jgi:hypothetical protein
MDEVLPPAPKKSALPYVLIVGAVLLVCLCCCAALAGFFVLANSGEEDQAVPSDLGDAVEELDSAVDELGEALQESAGIDASQPRALTYELEQRVRLMNTGENPAKPVKLWVALIQDLPPYQLVQSLETDPLKYEIITDEYDNQYALFTIQQLDAGEEALVTLRYQVELSQVQANMDDCQGSLPDTDIFPEKYVESDAPEIVALANELSAGKQNVCEISRAIYDYVADNMEYTTYNPDDLGALAALEQKKGDCTEFSDLLVALHRAAGIPARMIDGVNCCTINGYDEGQNKHNWAEVYLPGSGWVQMDPTWGRDPAARDQYFASTTFDHFLITRGRNLNTLDNYYYLMFRWWQDEGETQVDFSEEWDILQAE